MQTSDQQLFDPSLTSTLFPSLVNLATLAATSTPTADTANGVTGGDAQSKLELNKQAAQLRNTLTTLQQQATTIPAGNLSLEDQDWLIERLESEVQRKKDDLAKMAELTALASGTTAPAAEDQMDVA
ncbi:hypothetical protein JCM11641_005074 [Rhodosporidiobolus odoratus]